MPFHFRSFSVEDDRSTMKTGTDSVLLGSWADVSHAKNILEVGTGSGLIALMLAQRSTARIDAIDIDPSSVSQAAENFSRSPWYGRLTSRCISLREFSKVTSNKYDLIVSNPPYFSTSLRTSDLQKNKARHRDETGWNDFLSCARILLSHSGKLAVILPFSGRNSFCGAALKHLLFLSRETMVFTKKTKKPELIILEFQAEQTGKPVIMELWLRDQDNNFSTEYLEPTKEFYLSLK